jgi:hypothetical protein
LCLESFHHQKVKITLNLTTIDFEIVGGLNDEKPPFLSSSKPANTIVEPICGSEQ